MKPEFDSLDASDPISQASSSKQPPNGESVWDKVSIHAGSLPTSASDVKERYIKELASRQILNERPVLHRLSELVVGKLAKDEFFRLHKDLYRNLSLYAKDIGTTRRFFPVTQDMESRIKSKMYTAFYGVQLSGKRFLWPVNASSSDSYTTSAWRVVAQAMEGWVRMETDNDEKRHIGYPMPVGNTSKTKPQWGDIASFDDLLREAFKNEDIIADENHPIYRALNPL